MFGIEFRKSKFTTNVLRNNAPLKIKANSCRCVKAVHAEENKSWYIVISIPSDILNLIKEVDLSASSYCSSTSYLQSIYNDNMKVKIPYRYKKLECEFYDNNNNRIISSDIKENDLISLEIECSSLWEISNERGKLSGLTWKTNLIKHM